MPLVNNRHIRSETVTRRVVRVGSVERWLILRTGLRGDSPEMSELIRDAHGFPSKRTPSSLASQLTKQSCPLGLRQLHNSASVA